MCRYYPKALCLRDDMEKCEGPLIQALSEGEL